MGTFIACSCAAEPLSPKPGQERGQAVNVGQLFVLIVHRREYLRSGAVGPVCPDKTFLSSVRVDEVVLVVDVAQDLLGAGYFIPSDAVTQKFVLCSLGSGPGPRCHAEGGDIRLRNRAFTPRSVNSNHD